MQELFHSNIEISLKTSKSYYSSLHNRVSKILRPNAGFALKLTVFYFI
ncbi:hypothetical protein LEP1GSC043_4541 [Leptospira weilii str. Ecochallenge]|uniref:Uncharacterized protein n=1 Tax=Leptospira weilii str. Ecochallenge TaxID=1049986 RepID=N1U136_9LEPT|nr:hypothetical protein LEP1GSC043_4541 [Leptospira weilii str. Ecochallenge]